MLASCPCQWEPLSVDVLPSQPSKQIREILFHQQDLIRYIGKHRRTGGRPGQSNPVLRQLGLRSLGRAARGHLLLTKTLLIVGQEGSTHREGAPEMAPNFEIHDPKLRFVAHRLQGLYDERQSHS